MSAELANFLQFTLGVCILCALIGFYSNHSNL